MKEKKAGRIIILVAFVVTLYFSKGIWFFAEKHFNQNNYENRELASKPQLTIDNYSTFPSEYNQYFNDNLPFRNNLITINSEIDYYCFKRSSNKGVIIGENDWLFYSKVDDGNPIASYKGEDLYSEEELIQFKNNCLAQRDFLAENGKEFVIFIAPNKERVYSEYMPKRFGNPAEHYRALQVYDYLKNNTDLRVIYPYEEIMRAKEDLDVNIWYKTDTHWNNIGGYVGAKALLKELDIDMPDITSDVIKINKGDNVSGDLAGMLNMNERLKHTDFEYSVEGYDEHEMETVTWDFHEAFIYHANNADSRKIYVIRDSFSTAMAKYIGSQFNDSYLRNNDTYTYEDYISQNPDVVVYETVERNVYELMNFSIQKSE